LACRRSDCRRSDPLPNKLDLTINDIGCFRRHPGVDRPEGGLKGLSHLVQQASTSKVRSRDLMARAEGSYQIGRGFESCCTLDKCKVIQLLHIH
jgi:hypothetical protein